MSTIIKAATGQLSGTSGSAQPVAFQLDDMAGQAGKYLDNVRHQAARIVAQARKDADAIKAKAESDGRQAALRAVEKVMEEKVHSQLATLLPALRKSIENIEHSRQEWLQHWGKNALRVASAIAERVIRREVSQQPQVTLDLVREALELAAGSADIAIHLHPQDHAALGRQVEALAAELVRVAPASVVADPQVSLGGCRVETRFGVIDQQFEAQLARIEQELTD
jgi:flagellar assembly protein FliH